jgi:hypothetical protein
MDNATRDVSEAHEQPQQPAALRGSMSGAMDNRSVGRKAAASDIACMPLRRNQRIGLNTAK